MSNSDNPRKGAEFQRQVKDWFEENYCMPFELEKKIAIGSPLVSMSDYKAHKFDLVSEDQTVVIECKRYTWTESDNVPSAKIGFVNEAAFYLSLVKRARKKYIVMLKSYNAKRDETLADYYCRTNKHLLGDVIVAEFDLDSGDMRFINEQDVERRRLERMHSLAEKYLSLYESSSTKEDAVCRTFPDECFSLGITMDCEKCFIEKYGEKSIQDSACFRRIREDITEIDILAAGIFSKWRYITHWSYGETCLEDENRAWFIEAFGRLGEITSEDG